MKCEKPITQNVREKANKLYAYFTTHPYYCTKEELELELGVGERIVRDIIALLRSKGVPIISTSGSKGYKLARLDNDDDYEKIKYMWAEIDSRIEELEINRKCCMRFVEQYEKRIQNNVLKGKSL